MAGLSKTKTKPNPKLKFELKFGTELCNIDLQVSNEWIKGIECASSIWIDANRANVEWANVTQFAIYI